MIVPVSIPQERLFQQLLLDEICLPVTKHSKPVDVEVSCGRQVRRRFLWADEERREEVIREKRNGYKKRRGYARRSNCAKKEKNHFQDEKCL